VVFVQPYAGRTIANWMEFLERVDAWGPQETEVIYAMAAVLKYGSNFARPLRPPQRTGVPIGIPLSGAGIAGIGHVGRQVSLYSQK
jgi:hypothetical protein